MGESPTPPPGFHPTQNVSAKDIDLCFSQDMSATSMSANSLPPRPISTPTSFAQSMQMDSILEALPTVPASSNHTYSGKRIRGTPKKLKVYFIPARNQVGQSSIIHSQKNDGGFFRHPALVVANNRSRRTAEFYAITSYPPKAIRDLKMYLRLGDTIVDQGPDTLMLAATSDKMPRVSHLNLDQRFTMEWEYLYEMPWGVDVNVDPRECYKLDSKIRQLEAQQNRYIYKPLPASFYDVAPGTVVMLSNPPTSRTFGAPIVILANNYPLLRFLRIKLQADNASFCLRGMPKYDIAQEYCLRLSGNAEDDIDEKPVLRFEHGSPELREASFVEVTQEIKTTTVDRLRTWCVPPVKVQAASMARLWDYMEKLPRHSGNMQPREYSRSIPSSLPDTRQNFGECYQHYQQHGRDNHSYRQPQGTPMQSQLTFYNAAQHSSRPNVANDHLECSRPNTSFGGQSNRQDLLQVPVTGVEYHPQSHGPLHMQQLPAPGPLTHQFALIEPTFTPAYYMHPGGGYVPFAQPSILAHHQGLYGYGYGWASMQPHHGYPNAPAITMNVSNYPEDAQSSRTSTPYTADSDPYSQEAPPPPHPHRW